MIRKAHHNDLPRIMNIFSVAKKFMRKSGNKNQWTNGYPSEEIIEKDIENGNFYVEEKNDNIIGCFAFIIGIEPTYHKIDGHWLNEEPYGTIHRIASDGSMPGFSDRCFKFCRSKIHDLRIDTHQDNKPMQSAVQRNGFKYCGVITLLDGSPRLAFQLGHNTTLPTTE